MKTSVYEKVLIFNCDFNELKIRRLIFLMLDWSNNILALARYLQVRPL